MNEKEITKKIAPVTMKAKDAAEYLGISYWLILEMAKQNKVPHIACGGRKLFRKAALDKWMVEQEQSVVIEKKEDKSFPQGYGTLRKIY